MLDGLCSPPETWVLPTFGNESGCLPPIPTPSASSYGSDQGGAAGRIGPVRHSLESMARHGLWPTPTVAAAKSGGRYGNGAPSLATAARDFWPTPTSTNHKQGANSKAGGASAGALLLPAAAGGMLNPTWVEWLMGWPIGWTDPDGGPSSEDFRAWLDDNRTALSAFVASATVKWPCAQPQRTDCSEGRSA